jgi:hypothetical protein
MANSDQQVLTQINANIGKFEEEGDWKSLKDCLAVQELRTGGEAPILAFRRVSGACVDARAYLDAVSKSAERKTEVTSITREGDHIAIVRCIVEMAGKKYINIRLFVREDSASSNWKLLGWANDLMS